MPPIKREKLVNALVGYFEDEVIKTLDPSLTKSVGVILDIGVHYLTANRNILSKYLEDDMVSAILGYNPVDDTFSIEELVSQAHAAIERHGGFMFTLEFPKIPFIDIGSQAIKVKLNATDLDNLVSRMN